jgi:hypothetical protein
MRSSFSRSRFLTDELIAKHMSDHVCLRLLRPLPHVNFKQDVPDHAVVPVLLSFDAIIHRSFLG